MDLESLNQTQEEDMKLEDEADETFAMIDPARIQELTVIIKYLCNVNFTLSSKLTYNRLQCMG